MDRRAFSVLGQLGFLPAEPRFDAAEISAAGRFEVVNVARAGMMLPSMPGYYRRFVAPIAPAIVVVYPTPAFYLMEAVPRVTDLGAAIEITRRRMTDAYLDEDECAEGIKALDRYRYEWIEAAQAWARQPYHDQWSNGADSFRQWAVGYQPEGAPATAGYESARGGFVKGGY